MVLAVWLLGRRVVFCHNGRHRLALGDARTLSNASLSSAMVVGG